jgi:hypothetical protein
MFGMAMAVMAIAGIFCFLAWACCAAAKYADDASTNVDEEIKALQVVGNVSRAAVGGANVVSLQTYRVRARSKECDLTPS